MEIDKIIAYECGELSDKETVDLFASLVKSGAAWSLQGSYGRTASALIESGKISKKGEVLSYQSNTWKVSGYATKL